MLFEAGGEDAAAPGLCTECQPQQGTGFLLLSAPRAIRSIPRATGPLSHTPQPFSPHSLPPDPGSNPVPHPPGPESYHTKGPPEHPGSQGLALVLF